MRSTRLAVFATTGLLAVISFAQTPSPAKDALVKVMAHYQSLKLFDATLVHHNDSGLFPGDYVQSLSWEAPNSFSLKVTTPASGESHRAPDFTCTNGSIHTEGGTYPTRPDEPLNTDINTMPGYEVSGGPILSWLLKSPSANLVIDPPNGMTATYAWGQPGLWHNMDVKVIMMTWTVSKNNSQLVKLYLNPKGDELVGWQYQLNGKTGYLIYKNQKLG